MACIMVKTTATHPHMLTLLMILWIHYIHIVLYVQLQDERLWLLLWKRSYMYF